MCTDRLQSGCQMNLNAHPACLGLSENRHGQLQPWDHCGSFEIIEIIVRYVFASVVQHLLSIYYLSSAELDHGDAEVSKHQPRLGEPQRGSGDRCSKGLFLTIRHGQWLAGGRPRGEGVTPTTVPWPCELPRDMAITHSLAPSRDESRLNLMQNIAAVVSTLGPAPTLSRFI